MKKNQIKKSNRQRISEKQRKTKETDIRIKINLDGSGKYEIDTGIPFLDHMLELFAKHGFFDLKIKAKGDIHIDYHHTIEDIGLTLGEAIAEAAGDKHGIKRYGWAVLPMDESLALISLDISGRPFLCYDVNYPTQRIKDIDTQLFNEFFRSLSIKAGLNLHIQLIKGKEIHHIFEVIFKGFAKALDQALSYDERISGVLSTKGMLE